MKRIAQAPKTRYFAALCCLLFLVTGWIFLPHLGLQNDEALFAGPLFPPKAAEVVKIGHSHIPLMLMSYLGTLKSLLYRPVFLLAGTGILATRTPMLFAGVAGLWLFYLFLRRAAGQRAAVVGCGLLAADTLYLLTICFDWGPVALQHLLLVSAMLLLLGFYQTRQLPRLFWGWFLLGLGMWDKALMTWILAGMLVAALAAASEQSDAMAPVHQFVDGFNQHEPNMSMAACAEQVSIIDDFPPYRWNACSDWIHAYDAWAKQNGVTDASVALGKTPYIEVVGDAAYVVVPADFTYKQNGKPMKETGATFTVVLHKGASGWLITAWSWSHP